MISKVKITELSTTFPFFHHSFSNLWHRIWHSQFQLGVIFWWSFYKPIRLQHTRFRKYCSLFSSTAKLGRNFPLPHETVSVYLDIFKIIQLVLYISPIWWILLVSNLKTSPGFLLCNCYYERSIWIGLYYFTKS